METLDRFCQKGKSLYISLIILFLSISFIMPRNVDAASTLVPFNDPGWNYRDLDAKNNTPFQYIQNSDLYLNASGADMWKDASGAYDQFVDYYRNNLAGNWDVVVRVVSQENTNSWAKAGLIVKNNLKYSASDNNGTTGYCMVAVTPGNGYVFQWDSAPADKYLDQTTSLGTTSYPVWLRLKKAGTTFTSYYSHSNSNPPLSNEWTQIDSRIIASANNAQDVGVFVTGHNTSDFCEVRFSKFWMYDSSPVTHTITASAGANGSISPSGTVAVTDGFNQMFSISPNLGYNIQTLIIDGSSVAVQNSYTFSNVVTDHSISATFVITTNNITASAGAHGSISPSGSVAVNYGASQSFTVTPDGGYRVDQVLVDGVTANLTNNAYTFSNVTGTHSISVTFAQITHNVTATSGAHGSISPSGVTAVADGGNQLYTISVDAGYYVASFTVDGTAASLDASNHYTLSNVTADHTVAVTFAETQTVTNEIPGCGIKATSNYTNGFNSADFSLQNIAVQNGKMVLQTGNQAINPENIVIPFKQEVAVTFIYEGAGYVSDFGYVLKSDAVNADGTFKGWNNIPLNKRHPVFHNVNDDNETGGCCGGGNGIFDGDYGNDNAFPANSEAGLTTYNAKILSNPNVANAANSTNAAYGDGTGLPFTVDGNGSETARDMKKVLGTFDAGTELVFFLTADKDWTTMDTSGVFFTKKTWNTDTYSACTPTSTGETARVYDESVLPCDEANGYFAKSYYVDNALAGESGCLVNSGWLMPPAVNRLSSIFNVNLNSDSTTIVGATNRDVYPLCIKTAQKYSHVIVGAPANDPNQWILGWEDLVGAGDSDHNDMVFKIDRKTGGVAQLQSQNAIVPTDSNGNPLAGAYFTGVTMEVWDRMPCNGKTKITYWASIDNGDSWYEITTWDTIKASDASQTIGVAVANWTPGSPEYTYRSVTIDFAGLGKCGDKLIWKAQLESQDQACAPEILNVSLNGTVATNGSFSRSSPIILANMSYSGSYETPSISWADKTILRGHLRATRIYDPAVTTATNAAEVWDAGASLNSKTVDSRKILFPSVTVSGVANEVLATGDGTTVTFGGTSSYLAHHPVSATTVKITDTIETFADKHTNVLEGSLGGAGTINRYTGQYQITFKTAPGNGVPITATYSYYTTSNTLPEFTQANITSSMLGIDNTYIVGHGFNYDFNNDGKFNNVAHDGTGVADDSDADWLVEWFRGYKDGSLKNHKKEWILGAIDHSVPAVESPPGTPKWYFGTDITEDERKTYNDFKEANKTRSTVVYVGARDGMLHAFNAGQFRWGNNEKTGNIAENRGYFAWTGLDSSTADYGNGSEVWAFIPANLLSRLKNNLLQPEDSAMVDASPTLADVYVGGSWKTILASAEGNGGDSVFCLDVTDPNDPKFMWEYADPDLFRSRSSPTVGLGRMVVGGTPTWVALFVSGKSNDANVYPSIYIVDVGTGELIERVFLDDDPDNDGRGRGGVPSGQPAIVDSDGNGFIDRVYIGTDKGFMYKVNLPDDPKSSFKQITHCVINSDFSYTDSQGNSYVLAESQRYHPVYASPTVTVNNTLAEAGAIQYNINIFFGTGDSPYYDENINTGNTRYHFFSYSDKANKGVCDSDTSLAWYFELPAGQRVWASAFAAAENIYFGTATAETEDPCNATAEGKNEGQLYVFSTAGSEKKAFNTGNIVTSPVVEDEHIYFRTSDGLNSMGSNVYNNAKTKVGTGASRIISWEETSD